MHTEELQDSSGSLFKCAPYARMLSCALAHTSGAWRVTCGSDGSPPWISASTMAASMGRQACGTAISLSPSLGAIASFITNLSRTIACGSPNGGEHTRAHFVWTVLQLIKEASVHLRSELFSTTATKSMPGSAPPAAKRKYSRASLSTGKEVVATSSFPSSSSTASRASSSASENWPTQQISLHPKRTAWSAKLNDDSTSDILEAGSNNA